MPNLLHACLDAETWLGFKDDAWFVSLLKYLDNREKVSPAHWAVESFYSRLKSKRIFPVHDVKLDLPPLKPLPQGEPALRERVGPMPIRTDLTSVAIADGLKTSLFFLPEDENLHLIPSARSSNAARRRARAHPCHHQRGGRR